MLEVGRDHWGSSNATPLLRQGHLEHTAQDCVQMDLEYPQGRRLHNLSGQPAPMLSKEVLHVQMKLPGVCFMPIASHSVTWHHQEESGLILLTPSLQILTHTDQIP